MKTITEVSLAGLTIPCALRYPETARYFSDPDSGAIRVEADPVCLSEEDWRHFQGLGMEACARTEFSLLTAAFSDALMSYDRIILHSVAIRWRDRAWLIAARSGVGKSTQTSFLRQLRPGEFGVICGDRPILEFRPTAAVEAAIGRLPEATSPDKEIIVHPAPWNGKENWYGAEAAPLAGLILLERGEENRLVSLSPKEAALRTYGQVIQRSVDAEKIRKAADLVTRLLISVPIWQLTSFQVPDSTRLLLEAIFS